jgi:hypothetical protein
MSNKKSTKKVFGTPYSTLPKIITESAKTIFKEALNEDFEGAYLFDSVDFLLRSNSKYGFNPKRPYIQQEPRRQYINKCAKLDQLFDIGSGNVTHIFLDSLAFYHTFLSKLKINTNMDLLNIFNARFKTWRPKQLVSLRTAALFFQSINNQEDLDNVKKLLQPSRFTFIVHIPQISTMSMHYIPASFAVTIDTINMHESNSEGLAFIKESYGSRFSPLVPFGTVYIQALQTKVVQVKHTKVHIIEDDIYENVIEVMSPLNIKTFQNINEYTQDELDSRRDVIDRILAAINITLYKMTFPSYSVPEIPRDAIFNGNIRMSDYKTVEHLKVSEKIISSSSKETHFRSAHFRTYRHPRFINAFGKTIWINATVVNYNGKSKIEIIGEKDIAENYESFASA